MTNSDTFTEIKRILAASGLDTPLAYVMTFGCQQNEADSEKLRGILVSAGYIISSSPENCDLILVNTCAVREHAEKRALSLIGQLKHEKQKKPGMIIGVCGCMTAQAHRVNDIKMRYPYVSFTTDPSEIAMLPSLILDALRGGKRVFPVGESTDNIGENIPIVRESSYKADVSIMYGCNNFCSYCIVPYVRGRERSRRAEDVLSEIGGLLEAGYKEITLLGQNVNSFDGGMSFAQLLSKAAGFDGEYIVRFMTSHPKDASDELISAIAENKKIARHFHLPVQSGSDRILKIMNRRYDSKKYLSVISKLRAAIPDIAITSDIIVGFPGETENDFAETLDIIKAADFDMCYSFIYSPRSGTPAAAMPEQVPEEIKGERFRRLLELQNSMAFEKNRKYIGKTCRVLCEGRSKNNESFMTGRTDTAKLVHFEGTDDIAGSFADVTVTAAQPFALIGELKK